MDNKHFFLNRTIFKPHIARSTARITAKKLTCIFVADARQRSCWRWRGTWRARCWSVAAASRTRCPTCAPSCVTRRRRELMTKVGSHTCAEKISLHPSDPLPISSAKTCQLKLSQHGKKIILFSILHSWNVNNSNSFMFLSFIVCPLSENHCIYIYMYEKYKGIDFKIVTR